MRSLQIGNCPLTGCRPHPSPSVATAPAAVELPNTTRSLERGALLESGLTVPITSNGIETSWRSMSRPKEEPLSVGLNSVIWVEMWSHFGLLALGNTCQAPPKLRGSWGGFRGVGHDLGRAAAETHAAPHARGSDPNITLSQFGVSPQPCRPHSQDPESHQGFHLPGHGKAKRKEAKSPRQPCASQETKEMECGPHYNFTIPVLAWPQSPLLALKGVYHSERRAACRCLLPCLVAASLNPARCLAVPVSPPAESQSCQLPHGERDPTDMEGVGLTATTGMMGTMEMEVLDS